MGRGVEIVFKTSMKIFGDSTGVKSSYFRKSPNASLVETLICGLKALSTLLLFLSPSLRPL